MKPQACREADLFCPECGKQTNGDDSFCVHCGTSLDTARSDSLTEPEAVVISGKKKISLALLFAAIGVFLLTAGTAIAVVADVFPGSREAVNEVIPESDDIKPPMTDAVMFRANPARTGVYESPAVEGKNILMSYSAGNKIPSSPAVSDGVVFFGTINQNISVSGLGFYAVDASTGKQKWMVKVGDEGVGTSPAIQDGIVYFGGQDFSVRALDAATGSEIWKATTGGRVRSSPVIADGILYICLRDAAQIIALDAKTGEFRWQSSTNGYGYSSPSVVDGTVFYGDTPGGPGRGTMYFHAADAKTGQEKWRMDTGRFGSANAPSVADGVVIFDSDGFIAANVTTGKELWRYSPVKPGGDNVAIKDGLVFVTSGTGDLIALDLRTGVQKWKYAGTSGSSALTESPVVAGNTVYFSKGSDLFAIDAVTGTENWRFRASSVITSSSPAVAGGRIYFGCEDGTLYALGAPDADAGPSTTQN